MSQTLPDSSKDIAQALAESYPPLARYCPHLHRVSLPQAVFLLDDGREAVYGGAARGGKSEALLMAAIQYVDWPGYSALILRRTFPELLGADGLLVRAQVWLANTDAVSNESGKLWTFPSGATLRFGHAETEQDRFKYDGQAYQFVGFDELTSFTEIQYDHVGFTRMSRPEEIQVPLRTRGSCTPTGAGYGWVRRRFITHRQDDVLFVPARVRDNPGVVAEEYEQGLERVPEMLRRRLLDGDWDAFEGAAFSNFDQKLHLVPPFDPPASWLRFESHDHGVANPTATLAWASDYDGNLVTFDSYYAPGLVSEHAAAISVKRAAWWPKDERGWLTQSHLSFADPSMWSRTGGQTKQGDPASVVTEYLEANVDGFVRGNNDRKAGRLRLLELLRPDKERPFPSWHPRAGEYGSPRWFIVGSRCPELVEQLSTAPANAEPVGQSVATGEIVDPKWESSHGHALAAARYGGLSWQAASPEPPRVVEDLRQAAAQHIFDAGDMEDDDLDRLGVAFIN